MFNFHVNAATLSSQGQKSFGGPGENSVSLLSTMIMQDNLLFLVQTAASEREVLGSGI